MAKTTAHGWGAKGTNALEGVETSPGTSSSESPESEKRNESEPQPSHPSPAPKTERRSNKIPPERYAIVNSADTPGKGEE